MAGAGKPIIIFNRKFTSSFMVGIFRQVMLVFGGVTKDRSKEKKITPPTHARLPKPNMTLDKSKHLSGCISYLKMVIFYPVMSVGFKASSGERSTETKSLLSGPGSGILFQSGRRDSDLPWKAMFHRMYI